MFNISVAKEFTKGWNKSYHATVFNNKYRIYLPINYVTPKKELSNVCKSNARPPVPIKEYLKSKNYYCWNYKEGIAKKYAVRNYWNDHNQQNTFKKIGKIISKEPELKKLFDNDKSRTAVKSVKGVKYKLVISRHPYDIYGASTDRNWKSCLRWPNGQEAHTLPHEIIHNSMIAYLITDDDLNIRKPISRIMIRPIKMSNDEYLFIPNRRYGMGIRELNDIFESTVEQWLVDKSFIRPGVGSMIDTIYNEFENSAKMFGDIKMMGLGSDTTRFLVPTINNVIEALAYIDLLLVHKSKIQHIATYEQISEIYKYVCRRLFQLINGSEGNRTNHNVFSHEILKKSTLEDLQHFHDKTFSFLSEHKGAISNSQRTDILTNLSALSFHLFEKSDAPNG